MRLRILEWKNTTTLYIAVVQPLDRFMPDTMRELKRAGLEIWMVGRLRETGRDDLYALGFKKYDMDFDEAKQRAIEAVNRYNTLAETGKNPLA